MNITHLTHQQAVNREKDIQDELERLKSKPDKTVDDQMRVGPLVDEFREIHQHRLDLEHDAALAEIRSATGAKPASAGSERDDAPKLDKVDQIRGDAPSLGGKYRNPWDISEMRFGGNGNAKELRSRAFDAIERMPHASDKVRAAATKFIERAKEGMPLAQMVLATTSEEYTSAFMKVIRSKGQLGALNSGEQFALQRAMSLTDTEGGFLVPFQLDPTVILTANGSFNQIRQIARVVQTQGDKWRGITSAGVTGSWDGEGEEADDASPALARPEIDVHKGDVFVAQSFELQADAAGLADEIAKMIAFEKDRMESVAHVTGSGTGQPKGVITALVAAGGSAIVPSATTDTFAVGDVFALDDALPERWSFNASWLAHRRIYNKMRQFDTNGGSALWGQLAEGIKPELLGHPDYRAEAMDGTINAGQDNYVLLKGDFANYVIVDRIGTTLSYIPHLMGASGRPTGESGWYAYFRTGGDAVNPAAFKLLNVT
ncbi:phage major capsid protein [Nocardia wallacei]|uniref:phage major capsid protein n=1 Tax=Nocardia wallacei TaxID=480035 RepID=UPI0024573291|nr:phage major capsid protein [Nocardia wallacei]